jgi:hypothetical protein
MKLLLICCLTALSTTAAQAQSLKPEDPTPLQQGLNKGTVDNMVGTQYWYFNAGPGKTRVHAQFKSMGLFGNPTRADITVTLYDQAKTWSTPHILSSAGPSAAFDFDGDLKKETKVLVSVAPPPNGLVRTGGDYELEATGAVQFGQKSNVDPIVHTYNQMAGYTVLLGASKFLPDGTIQTASGANGTWKLFDQSTHTYVINIDGQERHSLQYSAGRGLVDSDVIIFQELK